MSQPCVICTNTPLSPPSAPDVGLCGCISLVSTTGVATPPPSCQGPWCFAAPLPSPRLQGEVTLIIKIPAPPYFSQGTDFIDKKAVCGVG